MLSRTDKRPMQTLEGGLAGSHTLVEQCHQCLSEAYMQAQASSTIDFHESNGWQEALHHKRKAIAAMLLHYGMMSTQVAFEQIQLANMLHAITSAMGEEGAVELLAEAEQQQTEAKSVLELHYGAAGAQLVLQ